MWLQVIKQQRWLSVIGALLYTLVCSTEGWSAGLMTGLRHELNAPAMAPQWPIIKNESQELLGLYGGIATVQRVAGSLESATLVILPTGHVLPLLDNGDIATFPIAYFENSDCKGREYLPPSISYSGLMPFRGVIYRSLQSERLAYIPKQGVISNAQILSRSVISSEGLVICESFEKDLPLFLTEPNAPNITGLDNDRELGLAAIEVESYRAKRRQSGKQTESEHIGESEGEGGFILDDQQYQECSLGCDVGAVGNNACDIACYTEACSYDGGDCASMNALELQRALSSMCSQGCFKSDIGDGFCDAACDNLACRYDGGDCAQFGSGTEE